MIKGLLIKAISFLMILVLFSSCVSTTMMRVNAIEPTGKQVDNVEEASGAGTGFFVSENGLIITCAHVIEGNEKITVKIDTNEYRAEILKKDNDTDLAILKINYKNAYHFKISNFNTVNLGDKIYVLGFPLSTILGYDIRLTDGIVSSKSGINADQTYFQHSAPIQPGNSGGPIINSNFEIIGVAAAKLNDIITLSSSGAIPQNVNFAVKCNYITQNSQNIRFGKGNVRSINDAVNATVQVLCYEVSSQNNTLIRINNKIGYTVFYVYISPSSSNSWGSDFLGEDILRNGQTLTIRSLLSAGANGLYDIRLVDEDNDIYTKRSIRLSQNQTIEFTINDLDRSSDISNNDKPSVRIINNTGYTVYYVYISPTTIDKWEEDVLDDDVLLNGRSVSVRLAYPLSVTNRYDIKLKDGDGDTYTKWNVLITPNKTIEFTLRDID
jgi:S1-C subfamily serine protease